MNDEVIAPVRYGLSPHVISSGQVSVMSYKSQSSGIFLSLQIFRLSPHFRIVSGAPKRFAESITQLSGQPFEA